MGGALIRPPVAELLFRLYDRPLHPELFDAVAARAVARDGAQLTVRITRTGHALSWSRGRTHVEEVITTAAAELPGAGLWLTRRFDGSQSRRVELAGARYQVSAQVEVLAPEQFVHVHAELLADGARKGLVFHCRENNRVGLSPLGAVIAEALPRALSVHAFHTFPDEFAVVKTQSLIEYAD
ncbi:hypothetical protein GobsT_67860 [Gemmata obscuriglobus]|uniref:DUF2617 domain-containing protein n=1 Tax=Gemmata obscuriglobus TaxID=114 RepID=A0A2Z3HEW9_9BACT|nr:DUF2617 family protein [Gemmata obscuriglobus]AWM42067.1 DUF2617 domain-containing protein [Gemmata obscuriglobus]QEG31938.1 hypothetical protein GobsT_67860 [Gemmata obscuriglobus]VTS11288.1 Uncharacterized protein OS=Planctomyces maris DSM 8797 GN=PM8797T_12438 PE=4 SV=1: DUF2617 [Gemmata obscuriglobus UQM 2246]